MGMTSFFLTETDMEIGYIRNISYIRNNLSYNIKSHFPKDIENLFFELLLPNTKPILIGTIYLPPNQTTF